MNYKKIIQERLKKYKIYTERTEVCNSLLVDSYNENLCPFFLNQTLRSL